MKDIFHDDCVTITNVGDNCTYAPGCGSFKEKTFFNSYYNQTHKACLGIRSHTNADVYVHVRYTSAFINTVPSGIYSDTQSKLNVTLMDNEWIRKFNPVMFCEDFDVNVRVLPKFYFDLMRNSSIETDEFIAIDSDSIYTSIVINYPRIVDKYYDFPRFPLLLSISNMTHYVACNDTAPVYSTHDPFYPNSKAHVNGAPFSRCSEPVIIPPFRYCMDAYYSTTRVCPQDFLPISISSHHNPLAYKRFNIIPLR